MNQQIEKFITTHYYNLLTIAKKITKNHELSQDLLHEVILQLYNKENIILKEYCDDQIKYYIVAILRINWHSNTSPFFYKIRKEPSKYVDINQVYDLADVTPEEYENQIIFDILEEGWTELDWFRKSLFEMYMAMGSMKKVAKKTRIPISSVSRYINESRKQIKEYINVKSNE
jgi:RNA polymerase sigma factor (sigma-70 family)